jgi:hypothetical protein
MKEVPSYEDVAGRVRERVRERESKRAGERERDMMSIVNWLLD